MICNKCGQQNEDNVFFCCFCGTMLKQPDGGVCSEPDYASAVQPDYEARQSFMHETVVNENTAVDIESKAEKTTTAPTYEVKNAGTSVQQVGYTPPRNSYSGGIPVKNSSDGIGMAVAALVCGISSIVIPYIGLIVGVLAIIFGCVAKHKGNTSPMTTAGIVCGAVGIVVGLFWLVVCAVIIEETADMIYNSYPYYY